MKNYMTKKEIPTFWGVSATTYGAQGTPNWNPTYGVSSPDGTLEVWASPWYQQNTEIYQVQIALLNPMPGLGMFYLF